MIRHFVWGCVLIGSNWPVAAVQSALAPIQPELDYHSFANIDQFRLTHLQLDLRVDSEARVLRGVVGLLFKRLDAGATELILDTRDLSIVGVAAKAQGVLGALSKAETTWVSRPYHFERKDSLLGQALVIELPASKKPTELIRIEYETSAAAPGLQWVTAKRTAGRHQPFLFTLSEPLGARSWIPLQDTPQAAVTYSATIHTSEEVLAVMSARSMPQVPGYPVKRDGEYGFDMPDPVPPYLIALAVGDLQYRSIGARTGVFAEKTMLKAAVAEFADVGAMLDAAEKICGPYRWDRFDIVVMPPGFPAGTIGNPRLAFVSPTVIAGDRSETAAIAHGLARAWSGDLVRNATWRDLWLNEGFADYLQGRIVSAVYGAPRDTILRVAAVDALRADLVRLDPADQSLAVDLRDRDPAEFIGVVPSVKGGLLLAWLDAKFGRERFDAFLRGYFDHYAFKNVTTEQFVDYLERNLLDRFPGIANRDQVMSWIGAPGLPADAVLPSTDAFTPVDAALAAWTEHGLAAKKLDVRGWSAPQWVHFLHGLTAPLQAAQMGELDAAFGFARSPNAEIAQAWFSVVIRQQYQPDYVRLEEYLASIGRRAFIAPLYTALMQTAAGTAQARRVFAVARAGYAPETAAAIDRIVDLNGVAEDAND